MPRQARIEYEGAICHVMSRGDRREDIVIGDEDRTRFVKTLGEACGKCGWEVHAWCLMTNHFHVVVETPQGNLVAGITAPQDYAISTKRKGVRRTKRKGEGKGSVLAFDISEWIRWAFEGQGVGPRY